MPHKSSVILLAEDDGGHARLLKRSLARIGLANPVVHVVDGQQALDFLFRKGDYSDRDAGDPLLAVIDVKMPRIDGVEVLRRVRSEPRLATLPVLMLTTTDDPREMAPCLELGFEHHLKKPVAYPAFVEALCRMGLLLQVVARPDMPGPSEELS